MNLIESADVIQAESAKANASLVPVILSGGAGTRLWPVSREQHPKPFMRLADGLSLLQKTYLRAIGLPDVERVLTVTNRELLFKTHDEYAEVDGGHKPSTFILEPIGRNTAPAVAAAALWVQASLGPQTELLVLPADHLVENLDAFATAVARARRLAADGRLVTFGIRPDAPETGFGYIEADGEQVRRFVEKPELETARGFIADGRHLWNSGMFCFRATTVLREFEAHAGHLLAAVSACMKSAHHLQGVGDERVELEAASFERVPEISLDYAVMEHSTEVSVVACDLGWSDIGSWNAMSALCKPDDHGNRILGQTLLHDAERCYVQSPERIVGLVGVRDLIVVDTPDAVLVAHRDKAQEVRQLAAQLKASGHEAYKLHREVHRPWGTYTVLEEGEHFKIKRIVVKPQAALSLQLHHHRSEHWVVVSGTAKVLNGEREMLIRPDESTYIPAGTPHRLSNPGLIELVMIEVQSGSYVGEDDIVRLGDDYGRV